MVLFLTADLTHVKRVLGRDLSRTREGLIICSALGKCANVFLMRNARDELTRLLVTYMDFHMCSQVTTFSETFAATLAFEGLLACVAAHMNFKGARPHETLRALRAFEGSLPRVAPLVIGKMSMRGEGSAASLEVALERFFAIMNPKVRLQIAFLSEALTTPWKVTYEWLFTDMGPLVDLEAPGARVALSADVADIGFRPSVYQLVRLKMPLSYKTLVAVFKLTYKWPSASLLKQNGR